MQYYEYLEFDGRRFVLKDDSWTPPEQKDQTAPKDESVEDIKDGQEDLEGAKEDLDKEELSLAELWRALPLVTR
jgi:hypothetical protein